MRAGTRGFTVVEAIVATLIATVVIVMAWSFFTGEQRRFRTDQSRLSGLQGAMQMDEALAWDLERIALQLPDQGAQFTVDEPVVITQGRRLDFHIFVEDAPRAQTVKTRPIAYRLDENTGRILRTEDGRERAFPGLVVEDVQWSLVPVKPLPQPGAFTFDRAAPLHVVKYVVTCYSETMRDVPAAQRKEHETVTLVGAVAIPFRSDRAHHPYWRGAPCEFVEPIR
jgi:hypothetical protein